MTQSTPAARMPEAASGPPPQWCALLPRPRAETVRSGLCATPVPWLIEHEWAKHGSCMAQSPEAYWGIARQIWSRFAWPDADALSRRPNLTVGDLREALGAHHLHPAAGGGEAVHHGHLGDVAAKVLPLGLDDLGPPLGGHIGKGQAQVAVGGLVRAAQRANQLQQSATQGRRHVHRHSPQNGGDQVIAEGFQAPEDSLAQRPI